MKGIVTRFVFVLSLVSMSMLGANSLNVKVNSEVAVLMDAETGRVLFEKNMTLLKNPASVTKIATFLYAMRTQKHSLDAVFLTHPECLKIVSHAVKKANHYSFPPYWLEPDGTHFSIKVGEEIPFNDLLYGLMLSSGNDAANVIAKNISGDIPIFVNEMNEYLKHLGCLHTHFTNPHGLYQPDHLTTAYDIALLTREAIKEPLFREVVSTLSYERPKTNKQSSFSIRQNNLLLREGRFHYPNAFGIKTGYTQLAGHNLVSAAEGNGRTLIVVLLNCEDRFGKYRDAISLFDAAFTEKKVKRLIFKWEENQFSKSIKKTKRPLQATLMEDVSIEFFPSEEPDVVSEIVWKTFIFPIKEGDVVGEILIKEKNSDQLIHSAPLHAIQSVKIKALYRFNNFVKKNLLFFAGIIVFIFLMRAFRKRKYSRRE